MWRCDCRKCAQFCLAGAAELSLRRRQTAGRKTAGRLATLTEPAHCQPADESPSTHFRGSTESDSIGSSDTVSEWISYRLKEQQSELIANDANRSSNYSQQANEARALSSRIGPRNLAGTRSVLASASGSRPRIQGPLVVVRPQPQPFRRACRQHPSIFAPSSPPSPTHTYTSASVYIATRNTTHSISSRHATTHTRPCQLVPRDPFITLLDSPHHHLSTRSARPFALTDAESWSLIELAPRPWNAAPSKACTASAGPHRANPATRLRAQRSP
ncbi:hypothetical protein L1887_56946 [Cichorium endivia]|nr:hypothetical protein L1887_56946 [Cichorium endivia]